jgi:hypothetical protein
MQQTELLTTLRYRFERLSDRCANIVTQSKTKRRQTNWIGLSKPVREAHRVWASKVGLPPVGNLTDLQSWSTALPYERANETDLARWLVTLDVIRSVHDWADAIRNQPDPYWPPDPRPAHVPIPAAAWTAADTGGGHEWMENLVQQLRNHEPNSTKPGWAKKTLAVGHPDLVGLLPAIMAAVWQAEHLACPTTSALRTRVATPTTFRDRQRPHRKAGLRSV